MGKWAVRCSKNSSPVYLKFNSRAPNWAAEWASSSTETIFDDELEALSACAQVTSFYEPVVVTLEEDQGSLFTKDWD